MSDEENKRLRAALGSWLRSNEAMEWLDDDSPLVRQTREMLGQRREAADEIERLRAALRAIADLDANPYEQAHVEIAREALGNE